MLRKAHLRGERRADFEISNSITERHATRPVLGGTNSAYNPLSTERQSSVALNGSIYVVKFCMTDQQSACLLSESILYVYNTEYSIVCYSRTALSNASVKWLSQVVRGNAALTLLQRSLRYLRLYRLRKQARCRCLLFPPLGSLSFHLSFSLAISRACRPTLLPCARNMLTTNSIVDLPPFES